ncbi:transposase [Streptomyces sp. NBC_00370]|uniref:transposase n=1 Tax=Streptomyces sp. NBC_00370 TaxID=2975728 RepID=UPI002E27440E
MPCLTARRDELFELADAVLCTGGPVKCPVDLTLTPEHRRGHGGMYGGLNKGRIDVEQLRTVLGARASTARHARQSHLPAGRRPRRRPRSDARARSRTLATPVSRHVHRTSSECRAAALGSRWRGTRKRGSAVSAMGVIDHGAATFPVCRCGGPPSSKRLPERSQPASTSR